MSACLRWRLGRLQGMHKPMSVEDFARLDNDEWMHANDESIASD